MLVTLESKLAPLANNPTAIAPNYQSNLQGEAYNFASLVIDQPTARGTAQPVRHRLRAKTGEDDAPTKPLA
jgi:hypothetical protein